jgi:hypothetical protein
VILAHGFTAPQLVEVVCAGLPTAAAQRIRAGGKVMKARRPPASIKLAL